MEINKMVQIENATRIQIDNLVLQAAIAQEKVWLMADTLSQEYFSHNEDYLKLAYFDSARIQQDILLDYVFQTGEALSQCRKVLDTLEPGDGSKGSEA